MSPDMASAIVDLVTQYKSGVSFVELMRLPGACGDREILIPETNIVLWQGVSAEFADALHAVRDRIEPRPCHFLVYLHDGILLKLPLAKRKPPPGGFRKPRWLPVTFRLRSVER